MCEIRLLHKLLPFLKIQQPDHKKNDAAQNQKDTTFDERILPNHGMNIGRYFEWINEYIPERITDTPWLASAIHVWVHENK